MTKPYRIDARSIGELIFKSAKNILAKKGFVDPRLINSWPAIMQEVSASGHIYRSSPVKIARTTKGRTLFVRSEDLGFKADLTYKRRAIIERANRFLPGRHQVIDVKLV